MGGRNQRNTQSDENNSTVQMTKMKRFKEKCKNLIIRYIFSYGQSELIKALKRRGVARGDFLMVHSSWLPSNGFRGKPVDFITAIKEVVGTDGLLSMTSMPYQNESTREFLQRGTPLKILSTPSKMGLLTEVFRRGKGVERSLNPAHPILAWGSKAKWFVEGHEKTEQSFGVGSPFDKLQNNSGKILCVDTPFSNITFTHFLEDRIALSLPFNLYDPEPLTGLVIDRDGRDVCVSTKVLSKQANSLRCEECLINELNKAGVIRRFKLGNTRFLLLNCKEMTFCVDKMVADGKSFFNTPIS